MRALRLCKYVQLEQNVGRLDEYLMSCVHMEVNGHVTVEWRECMYVCVCVRIVRLE